MLLIINVRAGYCGGIAGRGCPMLARLAERRTRPGVLRRKRGRL